MSRYYRSPGQRLYQAGATKPRTVACRRCGAPCRWGFLDGSRWVLFDAAPDPRAAFALDGGLARRVHAAWPGASWSYHHRHLCEEAPCPPAA